MTSLVDAESVLAVEVGSQNTRVLLFDVVDGQYHLIAAGQSVSTVGAPYRDASEGIHLALQQLQSITGRSLLDSESRIILPAQTDGSGADRLSLIVSAGAPLRIVTMGLLANVSLESADRLAATTYGQVIERISLSDTRRIDTQVDSLLAARPDLIVIAGGTENGATRSVNKLVELAALAAHVMPKEPRPMAIYCGNGKLAKRANETLEREVLMDVAPNIRADITQENIMPAQGLLAQVTSKIQARNIGGLEALSTRCSYPPLPSAYAFGRMIRFLSEITDPNKGVMGIDLGASSTVFATSIGAGAEATATLNVYQPLGMGTGITGLLGAVPLEDIARWMSTPISLDDLRDALYQKSLFPGMLPLTDEALDIELAAATAILELACTRLSEGNPSLKMAFDLTIVNGATLSGAPTPAQALLTVLNGIQPVGVGIYLLDPYGVTQALGGIAAGNTLLPVQVKDSGVYANLGTVIAPISDARPGTVILKVRIVTDNGSEKTIEVKQGTLITLPVRNGQVATLTVDTYQGTQLDPARPRLKSFKVVGGACGVVIDARGRPLALPEEDTRRRETLIHWRQGFVSQT